MGNICIYMLRHSNLVFYDDVGLQTIFSHKNIHFEERYDIYFLYFIFISTDFAIYNV